MVGEWMTREISQSAPGSGAPRSLTIRRLLTPPRQTETLIQTLELGARLTKSS